MSDRVPSRPAGDSPVWPALPHRDWGETIETLHLWTQIVGKVRMELSPWVNHSWSVTLYVTPRGLSTATIPCGARTLQIDFDFVSHELSIGTSDGRSRALALRPKTVARFHAELLDALRELDVEVRIHPVPNEIPNVIPFPEDEVHGAYEPSQVEALHGALVASDRVMQAFRACYLGKVSPVHFFWGGFDLAVTRFSGREAPSHPGGFPNLPDAIAREAYSHEVSSAGLWFGNRENPDPIFYCYAYPTPEGFARAPVEPGEAFWLEAMGEFALPYEAVRRSREPEETLFRFFQSTYEAAADLAGWDRDALEREPGYHPLER